MDLYNHYIRFYFYYFFYCCRYYYKLRGGAVRSAPKHATTRAASPFGPGSVTSPLASSTVPGASTGQSGSCRLLCLHHDGPNRCELRSTKATTYKHIHYLPFIQFTTIGDILVRFNVSDKCLRYLESEDVDIDALTYLQPDHFSLIALEPLDKYKIYLASGLLKYMTGDHTINKPEWYRVNLFVNPMYLK